MNFSLSNNKDYLGKTLLEIHKLENLNTVILRINLIKKSFQEN